MIVLVLVLFGIAPFFFKLKLLLSDSDGGVAVTVKLFGITLYSGIFTLKLRNHVRPQVYETRKGKTRLIYTAFKKKKKAKGTEYLIAALKAAKIRELDLTLRAGTGDAASTALVCGLLQAALDSAANFKNERIDHARIQTIPIFEKAAFDFSLHCIIAVWIADIMLEVIHLKGGGAKCTR